MCNVHQRAVSAVLLRLYNLLYFMIKQFEYCDICVYYQFSVLICVYTHVCSFLVKYIHVNICLFQYLHLHWLALYIWSLTLSFTRNNIITKVLKFYQCALSFSLKMIYLAFFNSQSRPCHLLESQIILCLFRVLQHRNDLFGVCQCCLYVGHITSYRRLLVFLLLIFFRLNNFNANK